MAGDFGFEPTGAERDYYFISYNSADQDRVAPIVRMLNDYGLSIWYDRGIPSATVWDEYIADKIEKCCEVILFMSKAVLAKKGTYVRLEYELATEDYEKKVHIVWMDDIKNQDVPKWSKLWWKRIQHIQGINITCVSETAEQVGLICRALGVEINHARADIPQNVSQDKMTKFTDENDINKSFEWILAKANETDTEPVVESIEETPVRYSEGLTFEKLDDGTYAVTGRGTCMDTELVIPPTTPEGGKVTSIGSFAFGFFQRRTLTSITIPTGVTSICDNAFGDCRSLESIDIPDSVISIGKGVFSGCYNLTSISVHPDNPEYYSLDNCIIERKTNRLVAGILTSRIPEAVASIGDKAYCGGRSSLESIDIPTSVFSIGDYAFADCCGLESIDIPTSVISIGEGVFSGCNDLTSISVRPKNWNFYSLDNCVIDRHGNVLVAGINTSQIPQGVKHIGNHAFSNLYDLFSIDLPNGVTSIGAGAFEGCENLEAIDLPNGVTSIGVGAFEGCENLEAIDIPTSVISIGDSAFSCCYGLTSVTIMSHIFSIGSFAFEDCRSLSTITIPDSVTSIGKWAFSGCCALPSIAIPNRVTLIGTGAFYGCSGLTSITIPTCVKSIGKDAFGDCSNATIYCEHPSQPPTWDENWNPDNRPVVWGYKPE